jgi:hypothetical protein
VRKTKNDQCFEMNRSTEVVIKSKEKLGVYTHKISVIHTITSMEPLEPKSEKAVRAIISNIDLDDDQTQLIPSETQTKIKEA